MTTVYVFGAGASHSYVQSPTGVRPPLARGFFAAYSELEISGDLEVRVGDIVNYVRDTYGLPPERFGEFDQDIESFMTVLDLTVRQLAAQIQGGDRSEPVFGRFAERVHAYDQMIFLVAHVLNEIQNGPPCTEYASFATELTRDDVVLTFNWDTLLDRALAGTGRWNADTGYGVLFEHVLDGGWRPPQACGSWPAYLKLHGSTNWLVNYVTRRLDDGERSMVSPGGIPGRATIGADMNWSVRDGELVFDPKVNLESYTSVRMSDLDANHPDMLPVALVDAPCGFPAYKDRARPDYEPYSYFFPPNRTTTDIPLMPLVVAPTLFKLYEEFAHVLEPLWQRAERAIASADRLVLIGYSLPPTDARAAALLRRAARDRTAPEILVVNPDAATVADRVADVLGVDVDRLRVESTDFGSWLGVR